LGFGFWVLGFGTIVFCRGRLQSALGAAGHNCSQVSLASTQTSPFPPPLWLGGSGVRGTAWAWCVVRRRRGSGRAVRGGSSGPGRAKPATGGRRSVGATDCLARAAAGPLASPSRLIRGTAPGRIAMRRRRRVSMREMECERTAVMAVPAIAGHGGTRATLEVLRAISKGRPRQTRNAPAPLWKIPAPDIGVGARAAWDAGSGAWRVAQDGHPAGLSRGIGFSPAPLAPGGSGLRLPGRGGLAAASPYTGANRCVPPPPLLTLRCLGRFAAASPYIRSPTSLHQR
jgi:hypothetical protein